MKYVIAYTVAAVLVSIVLATFRAYAQDYYDTHTGHLPPVFGGLFWPIMIIWLIVYALWRYACYASDQIGRDIARRIEAMKHEMYLRRRAEQERQR